MSLPLYKPCKQCGVPTPFEPLCFDCMEAAVDKVTYRPADRLGNAVPENSAARRIADFRSPLPRQADAREDGEDET